VAPSEFTLAEGEKEGIPFHLHVDCLTPLEGEEQQTLPEQRCNFFPAERTDHARGCVVGCGRSSKARRPAAGLGVGALALSWLF
jgi:hypothetical protein